MLDSQPDSLFIDICYCCVYCIFSLLNIFLHEYVVESVFQKYLLNSKIFLKNFPDQFLLKGFTSFALSESSVIKRNKCKGKYKNSQDLFIE